LTTFDAVLGQDQAGQLMAMALEKNRVGHAYLFAGADGTGKTLFAMELAKALLCRNDQPPHSIGCSECRMVSEDNHPDLSLVQAEEGKRFITIDQARKVSHMLSRRPVQSARRVVILRDADRMNDEAANSLLKTLEEPAPYAVLILTSSRPRNLLETIRSRCQELRFAPLSPEHVQTILSRQGEHEAHLVAFAARASQGSAGRAINALESGSIESHLDILGRVIDLPKEDPFALAGELIAWLKTIAPKLEPQRVQLRETIRLMVCAYRDILMLHEGGTAEDLLHADQVDTLYTIADRLSRERLLLIIESLWTARRQIDRNASMPLVLENLFTRIGSLQHAA
jgi:DNA polymerase III subunit delta'